MKAFDKIKNFFLYNTEDSGFKLKENASAAAYACGGERGRAETPAISGDIEKNYAYMKERFSYPENNDIVIKRFEMARGTRCFCMFIDGMVKTDHVNNGIIRPMQELTLLDEEYRVDESIMKRFISHAQAEALIDLDSVCEEINFGSAAVFVDGLEMCFSMDVRGWEHRGIDKPEKEQSIYGPQEAFGEMLRANSALIRKIVKTEKLICEAVKIGDVSKTRGVLMYIRDVANDSLINEIRRRINGISMDYVIAIEDVALMIEESSYTVTNRIFTTERPDRAARALTRGKAVLLLNGSPNALVLPTTALEMMSSPSDTYMRVDFANMARLIRFAACFFSCLLPGMYLAATLFHQEMIPTYLLYSISAARENVPFSSFIELILMDFAFEMIREAGLRMPAAIGSTLSIVGGLILGQAAVDAKIVSPITIIIIAVTGIGSFAVTDYSLGWSFRILRIMFILLGSALGFFGIALGIAVYALYVANMRSFGVPFLPERFFISRGRAESAAVVSPLWRSEKRPKFLAPKNERLEPRISRKWRRGKR